MGSGGVSGVVVGPSFTCIFECYCEPSGTFFGFKICLVVYSGVGSGGGGPRFFPVCYLYVLGVAIKMVFSYA